MSAPTKHYIDAERFTDHLITYKMTRNPVVLDRITRDYFYTLARGVMQRFDMKLVDKEDALQEIVTQCVLQIERYDHRHPTKHKGSTDDPDRKAFSFFTTCAKHTLLGLHRVERSKIDKTVRYRREVAERHIRENGVSRNRVHGVDDDYHNDDMSAQIAPEFQDWEN